MKQIPLVQVFVHFLLHNSDFSHNHYSPEVIFICIKLRFGVSRFCFFSDLHSRKKKEENIDEYLVFATWKRYRTFTAAGSSQPSVCAVLQDGERGYTHRGAWIIAPIGSQCSYAQNKALQENDERLSRLPSGNISRVPVNRIRFLPYGV